MKRIKTNVVSIDSLSPYVKKLILDAGEEVFFKAGQYLQVVMSENDKRPFSIANKPSLDGLIELHIGAAPENPYAYEVITKAQQEKNLLVEIGLGEAFLQKSSKKAILIAGGTGYSYAKSILLSLLSDQPEREVVLYWGARDESELYEKESLFQLSVVHKNFTFKPVVETPTDSWHYQVGKVHEAVLEDYSDFAELQVYVAGRFEMAAVIKKALLPLNLKQDDLFGDAFAFI